MGRLQIAAAAVLLTLLVLALLPKPAPSALQPPAPELPRASITALESGVADSSDGQVAYLTLGLGNSGLEAANITLSTLQYRPPTSAYIIEPPQSSPKNTRDAAAALRSSLPKYGFTLQKGEPDYGKIPDSLIIAPTGTMPSQLYHNLSALLANGNQIIYLGLPFDFLLEPDGSISKNPEQQNISSLSSSPLCDFLPSPSGGYLCILNRPQESFSPSELASAMLQIALFGPGTAPVSLQAQNISGVRTYFLPLVQDSARARIAYLFAGKGVLKQGALLVPLKYPQGSIAGGLSCFPGSDLHLALQANASYESPVELHFSLSAGKDGVRTSQVPAGSGLVRQIWAGSAEFPCPQSPGEYLLRLQDQFGRSYASARLVSRNFTVTLLSYSEGAYSFGVLLDSKPLDASLVRVRIEGSNNSETYPAMQGKATVFAKPARSGTFIFELLGEEGAQASAPFSPPQSTAGIYLWLGLPGLALVLLLYYAIRGRIGSKYSLTIDESVPGAQNTLELGSAAVIGIFEKTARSLSIGKQPLSFQELMLGFRRYAAPGRASFIADFNLQQLLDPNQYF